MINHTRMLSLCLSVGLHIPIVFAAPLTFQKVSPDISIKPETTIRYQVEKTELPKEVKISKKAPPTSGNQVLNPEALKKEDLEEAAAGNLRVIENSKDNPLEKLKDVFTGEKEKPKKENRKVQRRKLVPTAENVTLKNEKQKKIFFDYYGIIRKKIKEYTLYPYQAKKDLHEGTAYISFILNKNGKVHEILLLESSGSNALDVAAVDSIRNAEPFPPFPSILQENEIKLNVPISFELR